MVLKLSVYCSSYFSVASVLCPSSFRHCVLMLFIMDELSRFGYKRELIILKSITCCYIFVTA